MTDSVTKTWKIGKLVAERLSSSHIPIHILYKSCTCEKLDECCIDELYEVKSQLKVTDMIVQRKPQLKSFVCQSRWVAICTMTALLKCVAHGQSGKHVIR